MLKVGLTCLGAISLAAVVAWYPYPSGTVPEWRVQVIDVSGKAVANIRADEEWIDPIEDGIIRFDSRTTDADGWVVFPQHRTHNRLLLRILNRRLWTSAHVSLCWQGQYGDIFWDSPDWKLDHQLVLRPGSCPYG
jgi:hypothetical protein